MRGYSIQITLQSKKTNQMKPLNDELQLWWKTLTKSREIVAQKKFPNTTLWRLWPQCAWQHLIHHVFKSTNAHFIHSIGRWQNKWRGMHSAAKFPCVFLVFSIYFCYLRTNFGNVWMNKTEKPFCLQGCVRTFSNDNKYHTTCIPWFPRFRFPQFSN